MQRFAILTYQISKDFCLFLLEVIKMLCWQSYLNLKCCTWLGVCVCLGAVLRKVLGMSSGSLEQSKHNFFATAYCGLRRVDTAPVLSLLGLQMAQTLQTGTGGFLEPGKCTFFRNLS
jgi:hypothetical protein